MHFKIHRGTNEIGGTCVELWTETTRIIIDIGMPLVNKDRTRFNEAEIENLSREELIQRNILPDIPSLYQENSNTAIFISHSHKDHYGLWDNVHPSCSVYMGNATYQLINLVYNFLDKKIPFNNIQNFKHEEVVTIGDIEIIPYLMDHSAYDAYAFMIKASGKTLLYSGDFRAHGRKAKLFDLLRYKARNNTDYLLLEGSTIDRSEKPFETETDIENKFINTFKKTRGINLVFVSGQNIDRLTSIYRACLQCGKILLLDFYTANVVKMINTMFNKNIPSPGEFSNVKVYFPYYQAKLIKDRGKTEEFIDPLLSSSMSTENLDPIAHELVMTVRPHVMYDLEKGLQNYSDGCFIYSMYEGYKDDYKKLLDFITRKGMPIENIHTSGHADLATLKKLVNFIKPAYLVPIHTFHADKYARLFPKANVLRVDDRETVCTSIHCG